MTPSRTDQPSGAAPSFLRRGPEAFGLPVCRLGLASYAGSELRPADIRHALDRGVNFLNWAGEEDVFSRTIAGLGARRKDVIICVQFAARRAAEAAKELESILAALHTDYVDVLTLYYVESAEEWQELIAPDGALPYCRDAKRAGRVRRLGVTSHQRPLAAEMARSGLLDLLMIRYNAAHRGAEREVFPTTDALGMPVIAYTATRWGALLRPTPDDAPGFIVPPAWAWYRFVLQSPSVTVTLAAPQSRAELDEDLIVLEATGPLDAAQYERLAEHGQRVRRHGGGFP
jgi:predicted aldo/keto reductase-like oxidoreductase